MGRKNALIGRKWWFGPQTKITSVPVVEFVFVTICKILRIGLLDPQDVSIEIWSGVKLKYLDFFIRHPVTHPGIQFVQ